MSPRTASEHADEILRRFDQLDRALVRLGFPPTSPWWRRTIERWYRSGKRRLVVRAGRRAGKSSTLCRLAIVEALYGGHDVPPGDTGVAAIVSARRSDATERLTTIKAILDAIGVEYREKGDQVWIPGRRVRFEVFTASISGVSGFTAIFVFLDEVAKWKDSDTGVNPATEVIRSVTPTVATQPNAKIVLSSSPMGKLDAHAEAFDQGDTPLQTTAHGATWECNPTLTEQDTRDLEPDEVIWAREFAAIPQAEAETSLFAETTLLACTRPLVKDSPWAPWDERHHYVATMDPATRGNAWTFVITTLSDRRVRKVCFAHEWVGTKQKPLKSREVFAAMRPMLASYKLRHVHSDQWSEDTLRELAQLENVFLNVDMPWSAANKADAYDTTKTLAQEKLLELPDMKPLRSDLLGIRQKLTRNGIQYELSNQGARHSDYAPTVAMGLLLAVAPPKALPEKLTTADHAERVKQQFLREREKARKEVEKRARLGRLPPTHRR